MSYCVNGFCADSCDNRAPFVLVAVVALFMVLVFIYFFQKFPNFVVKHVRPGCVGTPSVWS